MSVFKKAYQLVVGGLRYDPTVFLLFCLSFIRPTQPTKVNELTNTELIKAIGRGRSVIRFGDGEALLLTGRDISFQPTSKELDKGLRIILRNYSDGAPYILGIPTNKLVDTEQALKAAGTLRIWRLYRVLFSKRFKKKPAYCPLTYFYTQNTFENDVMPLIKNRHIIWVSKEENYDKNLTDYFSQNAEQVTYINTPATNAFQMYEEIKAEVLVATHRHQLRPIILLAAGPATKVLAYELCKAGIQCLDVGQGVRVIAHSEDRADKI
jgi:hypothetical protein